MRGCLLDANAFSMLVYEGVPEKWERIWKDMRMGKTQLMLIEPLISEFYYKNIQRVGKKGSKDKIYHIKAWRNTQIINLDDNDAIMAGSFKVEYRKYSISLVDCFILAVCKRNRLKILTTDPGVRDVGKKLGVDVSFLPYGG